MDKGTGVGWRSALMALVCFVIRSGVKRRRGWSDDGQRETGQERKEDRKRTDIQTDQVEPVKERGRKRIRRRDWGPIKRELRG